MYSYAEDRHLTLHSSLLI